MNHITTISEPTTGRADPGSSAMPRHGEAYVLDAGAGPRHEFLNHLATTKVVADGGGSMSAVEFLAPRGFGPPLHSHDEEDELVVVLSGEVAFSVGDDRTTAAAGAIAYLPHNVPHTFQVLSDEARMLSVTSSATSTPVFDRMVAALGVPTEARSIPAPRDIDPAHVAEVCGAHSIQVIGPPPAPLVDQDAQR